MLPGDRLIVYQSRVLSHGPKVDSGTVLRWTAEFGEGKEKRPAPEGGEAQGETLSVFSDPESGHHRFHQLLDGRTHQVLLEVRRHLLGIVLVTDVQPDR